MTSTTSPEAPHTSDTPKRTLNTAHIVFFVVAAAAPLGFAVGSTPLAIGRGGTGTAVMFLIVGAFLMLFAVGYVAMARFVPNAGALFSFITAGLGRPFGLGIAFVAVLGYTVASSAAIGPFAAFANQATQSLFGWSSPWQLWAVLGVAAMGILGVLNVDLNLRTLGAIMILEVLALSVLAIGIIAKGGAAGLSLEILRPDKISVAGLGVVMLVVFAAFAGFEGTALFREEAKDPVSTVRRATFLAVGLIAGFQTFITWAIIQAFGAAAVEVANSEPTEMFAIAASTYVGDWLVATISLLVVFSWFASVLAFHNATARYLHALGRDGALPHLLARRSARTNAPWVASVTHTAVTVVLVGICIAGQFDPYLDLFVLGSLPVAVSLPAMECLTAIAIVAFFWRDRRGLSPWTTLAAPAVSGVALAIMVYLVVSNVELFTARQGAVNWILPGLNLVVMVAGVARALWMKRTAPAQYQGLGRWGIQ